MKRIFVTVSIIVILGITVSVCFFGCSNSRQTYSMFSWEEDAVLEENREELNRVIAEAGIDEIYQEFSDDLFASNEAEAFLEDMGNRDIKIYALAGAPEWALEADGASLIHEIKKIADVNDRLGNRSRIQGIMVDVEPYLLDEWGESDKSRNALMQSYVTGTIKAYRTAADCNLEMLVCIPTFYDNVCAEVLEEIVAGGCDGIAVMNYNRENEYAQIMDEVELARRYQKRVICIYELQAPGRHELTDINTYYNAGLKVLRASRETLQEQFNYDRLSFSYHYYKPLRKLLENTGT